MRIDLTQELWLLIQHKTSSIPHLPEWLGTVISLPFSALKNDMDDAIAVEEETVSESYVSFLKEQVRLNARGDEWSNILTARLKAIEPYKNKPLLLVSIGEGERQFYMRLTPPPKTDMVHWEIL